MSADQALQDELESWRLGHVADDHVEPSVVIFDLDGRDPGDLHAALQRHPHVPVLVTASDARPERVVEAMRAGAYDWLERPLDGSARRRLETALWHQKLTEQGQHMQRFLRSQAEEVEGDRRRLMQRITAMTAQLQSAHQQLQSRVAQLVMLYRIGRELSAHRNWDASLSAFLARLCEFLQAEGAVLLLTSQEGARLAPRCVHELPAEGIDATCSRLARDPLFGLGIEPALFPLDAEASPESRRTCRDAAGVWTHTAIPLEHRDQGLGYLVLVKEYDATSAEEDLYFLITIQTILGEEVAGAQAWTSLQRAQRFQSRTLDHVGNGVLTVDAEGNVLYANAPAKELVGVGADALLRQLGVGAEHQAFDRWLAAVGEQGVSVSKAWIREGESATPVTLRAIRLAGEVPGEQNFVVIVEDESTQRELEAERRRAARQDELLIMAAEWAHDVRTPLTGILHSAELLSDALPADSRKRRHFEVIRGEVERINNLVSNFLDFARPPQLRKGATELAQLAHETAALMQAKAKAAGVRLLVEAPSGELVAHVDRAQLKQVLLNLVTNAVEATPEGSVVVLRLDRIDLAAELSPALAYGGAAVLEVEDEGPGVPTDHLDRLFVPFFTTKSQGSGLGLAISEKVVRAHLGHLRYERREGRTVLRAILPLQASGSTTLESFPPTSLQARG